MDPILKRFSFRMTRGRAVAILVLAMLVGAAFWIGPLRPVPAELELLAAAHGRYAPDIRLDSMGAKRNESADSLYRFPLALAVRNTGARSASPRAVYLSVPSRFRLLDAKGAPVQGRRVPGNPLVRYRLSVRPSTIEPGGAAYPLMPHDTVWLEPALPDYYCTLTPGDVPEFIPAPTHDPQLISDVEIFYSFIAASSARQTGLLTVQIDPLLLRREEVPAPELNAPTFREPRAERPFMESLVKVGTRDAHCGEPDNDIELRTVLWETPEGGRFFVVYHGAAPRKYLFDLDHNGYIELEMWDPDGDGEFEGRRAVRYRVPSFLLPVQTATVVAGGRVRPDSAWLRNFNDVAAGPFRFLRNYRDTTTVPAPPPAEATPTPGPRPPDTSRWGLPLRPPPRDSVRRDTAAYYPVPREPMTRPPAPPDTPTQPPVPADPPVQDPVRPDTLRDATRYRDIWKRAIL
jgi:hypothetical protein